MKWQIYYSDGSTFNELDGLAEQAPAVGVQVIAQADKDLNFTAISGDDYYVWDDKGGGFRWWGADHIGFILYMIQPGWRKVLFGEMIDGEKFTEIHRHASEDLQVGRKTGFAPWERKPDE
jgi:hypothetical protein